MIWSSAALRARNKLSFHERNRVIARVRVFAEAPMLERFAGATRLNESGLWRLKAGDYRIFISLETKPPTVVDVLHRGTRLHSGGR